MYAYGFLQSLNVCCFDSLIQDNFPTESEVSHTFHTAPVIPVSKSGTLTVPNSEPVVHSTPLPSSRFAASDTGNNSVLFDQPNEELELESFVSPVEPDIGAVSAMEQQLKEANETKRRLQDDLNTVRENQALALEEARNEVAHAYMTQVASLQQSLVESEHSLQTFEREIANLKSSHGHEIETIVKQQEAARETVLHERDQKHAAHILRLTAELSEQHEFVDGGKNSDEQEAERIRMIKESMKNLHEKEISQMIQTHEADKSRLADEFRQQIETSTQQMELVANSKIQEMHAQFMSAHQSLLEQKNAAESTMEQLRNEQQQTTSQVEALMAENKKLKEQCRSIVESHSAELEEMNLNAHKLGDRVSTWKEKAADLESRLRSSGETHQNIRHMQEQCEAKLQKVTTQYEDQVASLEVEVKQHTETNAFLREQLERAKGEAQVHQEQLEELKSQHGSEVDLLEKSISEASNDKASLEAAEKHMSSLQKQLKEYRMQESDMNDKITTLKEEQARVVELLKQRYEQEKEQEMEALRSQFTSQIEVLQGQLSTARDTTLTSQAERTSSDTLSLQDLQSKHEEDLARLKESFYDSHTKALVSVRTEMEDAQLKNMETLKQQHKTELGLLQAKLEGVSEQLSKNIADGAVTLTELEEAHDVEITKLKDQHNQAIQQLQQSLDHQKSAALTEMHSKISSVEIELLKLRSAEAEWLEFRSDMMSQLEITQREIVEHQSLLNRASLTETQLREQCKHLKDRIQSIESDCNIAQSAKANMQQSLENAQAQVEELTARVAELQREAVSIEAIEAAGREQAQKLLSVTEQLANRNVTIADLQSQNDTLNTEVFGLTQKCQQQVSHIELLQRQVENSGAVSEEVIALQQQLSELAPIKEQHTRLQHSLAQAESAAQAKDEEVGVLQTRLEQTQEQVTVLETAVQSEDGEIGLLKAELAENKQMREEIKAKLTLKDAEFNALCSDLDQADVQIREMKAHFESKLEEVTSNSAREIKALKVQNASHCEQEHHLHQKLQQQEMSLAQSESTNQAQQEELSSAKEELNHLKAQLQEARSTNSQLQETNQTLSTEMQVSQEQSLRAQNSALTHLKSRYEELELNFATLTLEKERLIAELVQVREEGDGKVEECMLSWKDEVCKLEEIIEDLRSRLNAKEEIQSKLNQKIAEMQEQSRLDSTQLNDGGISLVTGQRSVLEESLSHARKKLSEKMCEKETLEKDLSFHRTELERRLGEKKQLEALLFEKARFEQELMNQKGQLLSDLQQVELKLQVGNVEQQQSNHILTPHTQQITTHGQSHQTDVSSFLSAHRKQVH